MPWLPNSNGPRRIFTNLVDFDTCMGIVNDTAGYAANLERFDARLADLLPRLRADDLLIVTADHGNDPDHTSTDHARASPLLVHGARVKRQCPGTRATLLTSPRPCQTTSASASWPMAPASLREIVAG